MKNRLCQSLVLVALVSSNAMVFAKDWPQWRGPNRDGISTETGILRNWPESGPSLLWRAGAGEGYSGISIANGRLYTMYGKARDELMVCLDAATGKETWRVKIDAKYANQFGNGPRGTPTVDGQVVYGISAKGKLYALNASNGKVVWKHDLNAEYGGQIPNWGVSTSPLVHGKLLLVDVAGKDNYGVVAFNKSNGKVVWKTKTDLPGYSSPIAVTVNDVEQIIFFTGTAAISIAPQDGQKYWSYPWRTSWDVNAATPIFIAPNKVFISSGYNKGAAVLKMRPMNASVKVEEVWKSKVMRNHFSTCLLIDNHLYGFDEGTLKCIDVRTQEKQWAVRRTAAKTGERGKALGKGSLTFADGHLIVLSEKGNLVLIEATPAEYREKASVQVLNGRCWTVPTLANRRLYVRNQKEMLCFDLSLDNQL